MNDNGNIKIDKIGDNSFDVYFYNNSNFYHDMHIFIYGILNIYNIDKGFPETVGITLLTSFKESKDSTAITFYSNELPNLNAEEKGFISQLMTQNFTKGFINYIYEKVKKSNINIQTDLIEFLRHLRNAASHGGFFNILGKTKKKAQWRGKEIKRNLHGTDLFKFIAIGDIIILLEDLAEIEKKQ